MTTDQTPRPDLATRIGRVAAPLREQVVEVLRQAILDFDYPPGARLVERELIEQTGVSRTTIREVLRELEAEGLVVSVPQKGAVVRVPTSEEAAELVAVRDALSALVLRSFVQEAQPEDVATVAAAVERFEAAVADHAKTRLLLELRDAVDAALVTGAGAHVSAEILALVQRRLRILRADCYRDAERARLVADGLRSSITALRRKDADTAIRAGREPLDASIISRASASTN